MSNVSLRSLRENMKSFLRFLTILRVNIVINQLCVCVSSYFFLSIKIFCRQERERERKMSRIYRGTREKEKRKTPYLKVLSALRAHCDTRPSLLTRNKNTNKSKTNNRRKTVTALLFSPHRQWEKTELSVLSSEWFRARDQDMSDVLVSAPTVMNGRNRIRTIDIWYPIVSSLSLRGKATDICVRYFLNANRIDFRFFAAWKTSTYTRRELLLLSKHLNWKSLSRSSSGGKSKMKRRRKKIRTTTNRVNKRGEARKTRELLGSMSRAARSASLSLSHSHLERATVTFKPCVSIHTQWRKIECQRAAFVGDDHVWTWPLRFSSSWFFQSAGRRQTRLVSLIELSRLRRSKMRREKRQTNRLEAIENDTKRRILFLFFFCSLKAVVVDILHLPFLHIGSRRGGDYLFVTWER